MEGREFIAAIYAILLVLLYFLPALVAAGRKHKSRSAIAVVNLFLGWTVIGWIAALAWAYTGNVPENPTASKACPFCAERIQAQAVVCRFCGRELAPTATVKTT